MNQVLDIMIEARRRYCRVNESRIHNGRNGRENQSYKIQSRNKNEKSEREALNQLDDFSFSIFLLYIGIGKSEMKLNCTVL